MSDQTGSPSGKVVENGSDPVTERFRISRAFWLSIVGLGCVVVLIAVLAFTRMAANDIASIVGLVASLVGTLVGAFFGLQIGSAGKDDAEKRANKANKDLISLVFDLTDKQKENLSPEVKKLYSK